MLAFDVAAPPLVGRRPELATVSRAIDGARAGHSAALVIEGDPGIGKTSLLRAAGDMATGFRLISARGIQSEAALAYAGLAELVRPLVDHLGALPRPQREALEGALALGPPGHGDRFAVYAATLGLLSAAAERAPVLCLVDDAHAMDTPSVEAVLFAARRLSDEGVVILVATRASHGGAPRTTGIPTIHLAALDDHDARRLIRTSRVAGELAPWVEEAILAASAGNPLALRELPEALPPEQRTGMAPLTEPLRPTRVVVAAFRDRLESLPGSARWAALLVACSTDGDLGAVIAALTCTGGAAADLEAAEAAGVVEVSRDRVLITHPVLRSVVIELAGGRDRRAAHRALADAIGREAGRERWGWHRAQCALGPDEEAAEALAAFAAGAGHRTGSAAAAAGFDRAARLTRDPDARAARLIAAAGAALEAGRPPWALQLAGEALLLTGDVLLRERAEFIRGTALLTTGDVGVAHRVLSQVPSDPAVPAGNAVERFALATYAALMADDLVAALGTARRGIERAATVSDPLVRLHSSAALALTRAIGGDLRGARNDLRFARATAREVAPSAATAQALSSMALASAYAEQFTAAETEIRALVGAMRSAGGAAGLSYPLVVAAEVRMRTGAWAEALAAAQEAHVLGEEAGQDTSVVFALVTMARLQALMGHELECRRQSARAAELIERAGAHALQVHVVAAPGVLELGLGRPAEALERLRPLAERTRGYGVGSPTVVPWRPDMVEALVRLGRRDEALRELRVLAQEAQRSGSRWAGACVGRCRGMVSSGDHDAHFIRALHMHETLGQPFERARTQLAYGERLRRERRRAEARALLSDALATFAALGASPWADRAQEELDASGLRARTRDPAITDRLTPRELQVALAVADGATNREAAARLYLSEKTIERHLGNVYRKLGLRSRSQLARRFAELDSERPSS